MPKITRLHGAADTCHGTIERALSELEYYANTVGIGKLIGVECGHIANYCERIRKDNHEQLRDYDPGTDDAMLVLVDRIGKLVNDPGFAPSVAPMFLRAMQFSVSSLRLAVATRLMDHESRARAEQTHAVSERPLSSKLA